MPEPHPHPQLRQPFHAANTSSSSSSVITVQRAASVGPGRSQSRPRAPISAQDVPSNASGQAYPSKPVTSPESRRAHSRSNSTSGGVREGVGNLNRWSQSTTSSKGSHSHQRSGSFSRRMSIGGGGGTFTFGNSGSSVATQSSPNKLTKRQGPPGSSVLPPLVTTPAEQQVVYGSSPPTGTVTPSTAGILSAALRSTVPDYFDGHWEDSQPRDFSVKRSPGRPSAESSSAAAAGRSSNSGLPRRHTEGEGSITSRGHSRNRSEAAKSSGGTGSSRDRSSKQPSQKAMLSKALQKANTAVLLDNAQNFEGAIQAYSEACALLRQVMVRSSGDEDKRKLEAIRTTYTSRISELKKIAPHLTDEGKALPARPESGSYKMDDPQSPVEEDDAVIETATVTRIVNDDSYYSGNTTQNSRSMTNSAVPRRRESLLPSALNSGPFTNNSSEPFIPRSYSKSPMRDRVTETSVNLSLPMDSQYMPPPLSPGRRPQEPMTYESSRPELSSSHLTTASPARGHARAPSNESMSWLDTIDESGDSTTSSVHSRSSSMGVRRKYIRAPSGVTEAEFDAALDAAVEAAYNDGVGLVESAETNSYYDDDDEIVANVRRRVELAKERVRQTEREAAIQDAHDRERKRMLQNEQTQPDRIYDDDDGNESEEEERMLEEMTRGYVMDDFEFGLQSKSALPRESDSSGFSGRTWNSSIGSNPTTAGTSLSTVTEASMIPQIPPSLRSKTPPPSHPPPGEALPPPPGSAQRGLASQSVRSRRLSGQNPKQLKIETTVKSFEQVGAIAPPPSMPPPRVPNGGQPKNAGLVGPRQGSTTSNRPSMPQSARQASSSFPGPSPTEIVSPPTPTPNQNLTNDSENTPLPRSGSPGRAQSRTDIRKNFSSSSLKNLKSRNLSVSNIDDGSDLSPNTPMSSQFASAREGAGRIPALPTLPTPIAAAFKEKMNGAPNGGLYLFNQDLHTPDSPGSPNPLNPGAPIPLEPCPNEFLLRPFWLMRALYQTIAHPRGGYLSTKLFVPRDVWRVKGVKIKGVEDKIANCDYLTAALMKLAQVDSFDADAVLEEMQSLETVLEQVQSMLTKKLGNEVGVQGSGGLFKDATGADAESGPTSGPKSGSMSSKSSSFSWRRLRSKNSGVGLANSYSNKTVPADTPKEGLTMSTLPMTSLTTIRFAKRDVSQVQFSGPHANYMSALAKLFDAAQVIDQIARQVEDPGLRHADKTQVGLELCTRHAAEFFGFYICRFVLTDISMLLDKFIKRGSEWVLV